MPRLSSRSRRGKGSAMPQSERLVTTGEILIWTLDERKRSLLRRICSSEPHSVEKGPVERLAEEVMRLWAKEDADAAE